MSVKILYLHWVEGTPQLCPFPGATFPINIPSTNPKAIPLMSLIVNTSSQATVPLDPTYAAGPMPSTIPSAPPLPDSPPPSFLALLPPSHSPPSFNPQPPQLPTP